MNNPLGVSPSKGNKTFNKRKNRALLTFRRSQKHLTMSIWQQRFAKKHYPETVKIAWFKVGPVPGL